MEERMVGRLNNGPLIRFTIILFVLMVAGTLVVAGDGKIPIWEATTITASGHYIVTRDITTAAGSALNIQGRDVTVDLNGFTVATADANAAVINHAPVVGTGRFYLLGGGKLKGGSYGLKSGDAASPDGADFLIWNTQIVNSTEAAVKLTNFNSLSAHGIVIVDGKVGFDLVGAAPPEPSHTVMISHSSIQADVGIHCTGLTCDISHNTLASCATAIWVEDALGGTASQNGISIPGSDVCFNPQPEPPAIGITNSPGYTATHNTINGVMTGVGTSPGIQITAGSNDAFIMDNAISGFDGDGIQVMANDAMIVGNLVNRNGGHGLSIGGVNNLVDGNKAASNGGNGLNVSTAGQVYRNNVLLGNSASLGGAGAADIVNGGGNVE